MVKAKSYRLVLSAKAFEFVKFAYAKGSLSPTCNDFLLTVSILLVVLSRKRNLRFLALPLPSNSHEVLSSTSDKEKLFTEVFSKYCYFDNSSSSIPGFSSTTTIGLHNTPATPRMFKKGITALDLSRASSVDCILVVVLRIYESQLFIH